MFGYYNMVYEITRTKLNKLKIIEKKQNKDDSKYKNYNCIYICLYQLN